MLLALVLAQAVSPIGNPRGPIFSQPSLMNRLAFFEAFPSNGAGTSGACSTTAPTGAKGEALTFTRASNGTCTKTASGGLATTGIADGDLVVLSSNVARVEYDSAGTLGLLVEAAKTNLLLRYIAIDDAAWSDVGTPTLTTGQTDPFGATAAVMIEDDDGAAYEGRSQAVTVSAGAAHTMHCYVKAGTLAEARITLDGTADTITGLSATTWSIIDVTDASSSGVSITAEVLAGDAVGDTGTVIFGGCQVETGSYRTSIIPTAGATATRAGDDARFALSPASLGNFSISASFQTPSTAALRRLHGALKKDGSNFIGSYQSAGVFVGQFISTAGGSQTFNDGNTATSGRAASYFDGTLLGACIDSACTTTAKVDFSTAGFTNPLSFQVGAYALTSGEIDGIQTRICFQPDSPTRCR